MFDSSRGGCRGGAPVAEVRADVRRRCGRRWRASGVPRRRSDSWRAALRRSRAPCADSRWRAWRVSVRRQDRAQVIVGRLQLALDGPHPTGSRRRAAGGAPARSDGSAARRRCRQDSAKAGSPWTSPTFSYAAASSRSSDGVVRRFASRGCRDTRSRAGRPVPVPWSIPAEFSMASWNSNRNELARRRTSLNRRSRAFPLLLRHVRLPRGRDHPADERQRRRAPPRRRPPCAA